MQNPAGFPDSCCEWFEIFNATDQSLTLEGVIVANRSETFTIDMPVVLAPKQYVVLGRNGVFGENGGVEIEFTYPNDFSLGNGLDRILLTSAQGLELDEVAWDNGGFFPDPDGASMQLDGSLDVLLQENSVAEAWCESENAYGDRGNLEAQASRTHPATLPTLNHSLSKKLRH